MQENQKQALRSALASLAKSHAVVVEQIEQTIQLLTQAIDADERVGIFSSHASLSETRESRLISYETLSVEWHGDHCFLGNTLLFWFFERLARTPNCYIANRELLDDVWHGDREHSTVRGVAKRLRDKLATQGMPDLASAIDGSVSGHYGLMLV